MAINQTQRPRYYEDQYLGADDLAQGVEYARIQDARHVLGGHTWGISIGLDLFEKPWPGSDRVDVYVTPGYAWDGYGRPIVVLAPAKLPESLFADIVYDSQNADDKAGRGRSIKVWLQYDEQNWRTPARGFESCHDGDHNSRVQESFRIVIGEHSKTQEHGSVVINSTAIDPVDAVGRFEGFPSLGSGGTSISAGRKLWDESVPQQEFPSADPRLPWLIPIGYVRWLPVQNGLGHFLAREDKDSTKEPDSDVIRRFRHYVGVVAESIEGAGGVIRLRDRFKNPDAINFRPPVITTDPQKPPENDLVWVEGDLRVVGDARLAGGKLAFRAADGKDEGTPLEIRRSGQQGLRTLQVIIGSDEEKTNRLAVGTVKKSDNSIDQKLVVMSDGKVGIGTDTPSQKLTIQSSFGTSLEITPTSASLPWKPDGTVNEGAFVINQQAVGSQKPDAGFAIMRDRKQRVILGEADTFISSQDRGVQKGQLRFFLNREEAGEKEVMRINDLGDVGIGSIAPTNKLHVDGITGIRQNRLYLSGDAGWSSIAYNAYHNVLNKGWVLPDPTHKAMTIELDDYKGDPRLEVASNVTADPGRWLSRLKIFGGTGSVVMAHNGGDVGIGTTEPKAKLQVVGGAIMPAVGNDPASGIQFPPDPGGGAGDQAFIRYFAQGGETTKLLIGINNDLDDTIGFHQFGSERMTIYNGNVGIGIMTPKKRLEVDGSVYITGNLGTRGYDPDSGYPPGWGGGIHTWDIYAEATITAKSKNFLIKHPLDKEHKLLVHSTIEGPEIAVFYRGEARLSNGAITVQLPEYFEALTRKNNRTVLLTPKLEDGKEISGLAASGVAEGQFSVRTIDGKKSSEAFYWEVKAVRADVDLLVVEHDQMTSSQAHII